MIGCSPEAAEGFSLEAMLYAASYAAPYLYHPDAVCLP